MIREFTAILEGLYSRGSLKIDLLGKEIFISEEKGCWQIATKISENNHPDVQKNRSYPFTNHSFIAVRDFEGEGVYFLYQVPRADRYTQFCKMMKSYLEEVDSFCEIFA